MLDEWAAYRHFDQRLIAETIFIRWRLVDEKKLCCNVCCSLSEGLSKKITAENLVDELNNKIADSESERTALDTNLKIEREWRTKLQDDSVKDKERIGAMQMELKHLEQLKKEYQVLHEKHVSLKKCYSEQEMALVEMGSHLSNSQQKVEEMKEVTQTMKDMRWAEDKDAAQCQQCNQPFSLARRKHHCRNCGGIFCHSCSDYTMPLPSSAKPVRVCDSCYTTLLQRYQRWQPTMLSVSSPVVELAQIQSASYENINRVSSDKTSYILLNIPRIVWFLKPTSWRLLFKSFLIYISLSILHDLGSVLQE